MNDASPAISNLGNGFPGPDSPDDRRLQRALDAPDRRRHAARRRAPKIVSSVVFFTRLPRPRSNRRVTGAVAGSLTALGTRATVSGTVALIVSTFLGHVYVAFQLQ